MPQPFSCGVGEGAGDALRRLWPSGLRLAMTQAPSPDVTLCLCGDVMTARGIDPLLPAELGTPEEVRVKAALDYVRDAATSLPRAVCFEYPWGDALALLRREQPDLRLINLATTITASTDSLASRLHAHLHPTQLPLLAAFGIDGAVLANRSVLSWGQDGLHDTLAALHQAGIACVGAGHDRAEAEQEVQWLLPGKARVRLFAFGHASSGLSPQCAAGEGSPGISWLPELDDSAVARLGERIRQGRMAGDLVIVALQWGPNWGYAVAEEQRRFAHALIDEAGVDLVWGYASHHPRPIEVYRGRLILYGVGDFLKDASVTSGHEEFRPDLAALYLLRYGPDGRLAELRLWPMRVHLFHLKRAGARDSHWLAQVLSREGRLQHTGLAPQPDGSLRLYWQ